MYNIQEPFSSTEEKSNEMKALLDKSREKHNKRMEELTALSALNKCKIKSLEEYIDELENRVIVLKSHS